MSQILDFFSSSQFMPHGTCFMWRPSVLWLHVLSDALVALAYYSIPLSLVLFARRRQDVPFRNIFYLFGAFIVLCGTTHLLSILVIWDPVYGLEGIVKLATAIVSILTAIILIRAMPLALQLKSPAQLAKLNAELQESYSAIEQTVQARTAALMAANSQLEENQIILSAALKAAEAASDAKSDFLANMSHEIRTPMNAIVGLSTLLDLDRTPAEKQRQFIETIRLSAQSLMDLINDLLDLSKLEHSRLELEQIPFNLPGVVDEAVRIMAVKAAEKKIKLEVSVDSSITGMFMGDPSRVRQILLNLIGNAVKFTDAGKVTVGVKTAKMGAGRCVRIDVADTGIGIPPEKLDAIFTKFTQADTSTTRKFGGTGLGLSICKMLVTLMGGRIFATSAVGQGSTFTVDLPLTRAAATKPGGAAMSAKPPQISSSPVSLYVLLVEDHLPNVLVATTVLDACGYRWRHVGSGAEALAALRAEKFDLVLMDIQMPQMDGLTATRVIRRREAEEGIGRVPVIGITAYALEGDRDKCLSAGMDEYLSKPFHPEDLQQKIALVVSAAAATPPSSAPGHTSS